MLHFQGRILSPTVSAFAPPFFQQVLSHLVPDRPGAVVEAGRPVAGFTVAVVAMTGPPALQMAFDLLAPVVQVGHPQRHPAPGNLGDQAAAGRFAAGVELEFERLRFWFGDRVLQDDSEGVAPVHGCLARR